MSPNPNKKDKSLKESPMPPLPFKEQPKPAKPVSEIKTVKEALEKVEEMQRFADEIEKKLEEVYRATGLTPQYLKAYFENASNFTVADWERINKEREEMLHALTPSVEMVKKKEKKVPDSLTKQRRKKGVGTRKNWLPMR